MLVASKNINSPISRSAMPISRKRNASSSKGSLVKKRKVEPPLPSEEEFIWPNFTNDVPSLTLQQLVELATAATNHYYTATPSEAKRQKKEITWPSQSAIAQLQAPDHWCFSETDKSHATELHNVGPEFQSVKFHPFWSNFGTAGIRATKSINGGVHYWQILLPGRVFGTSMMIGVGTQYARVHADGFVHLLGGLDNESWGLCHNGQLYHAGRYTRYTSPLPADEPTAIGVLFDSNSGTLTYYRNGRCLGVAFTGILTTQHIQNSQQPRYIFPMLSSTSAQTEMVLCCQLRNYSSLQDRCRSVIANSIDYSPKRVQELPLPDQLKSFVSQEVNPC